MDDRKSKEIEGERYERTLTNNIMEKGESNQQKGVFYGGCSKLRRCWGRDIVITAQNKKTKYTGAGFVF